MKTFYSKANRLLKLYFEFCALESYFDFRREIKTRIFSQCLHCDEQSRSRIFLYKRRSCDQPCPNHNYLVNLP